MSGLRSIASIQLEGLYGHQNVRANLFRGMTIIHGRNGSGKTTLLHVLANLMERDFRRFFNVPLSRIQIETHAGNRVEIRREESVKTTAEGRAVEIALKFLIDGKECATLSSPSSDISGLMQALENVIDTSPVYLPAFRSILEAISGRNRYGGVHHSEVDTDSPEFRAILERERKVLAIQSPGIRRPSFRIDEQATSLAAKTMLCRRWFGDFVPVIRYPSLQEVETALEEEIQSAFIRLSQTDEIALQKVFVNVLGAIKLRRGRPTNPEKTKKMLDEVRTKLRSMTASSRYAALEKSLKMFSAKKTGADGREVLKVYLEALTEREQTQVQVFRELERFEQSLKKFMQGKTLDIKSVASHRAPRPRLRSPSGQALPFAVLSSGERHVLTILFSATHMSSSSGTMLIDEPELSLHVDWQRMILSEVTNQVGNRQIIACTHSPEIAADHRDKLVELETAG